MSKTNKKKKIPKSDIKKDSSIVVENDESTAALASAKNAKSKKKKKNKKNKSDKNAATILLTTLIVIMVVFIILFSLGFGTIKYFIKKGINVVDNNAEAANSDRQVLPTGFVFEETGDSGQPKSPLENFIDIITGNNKKTKAENSGNNKDSTQSGNSLSPSNSDPSGESDLISSPDTATSPDSLKETEKTTAVQRKDEFYNFLVLAKDKGGGNTDTMMVVSFDIKNESIALLQIPRDTCVMYNDKMRKINSIYNSGYSSTKGSEKEKTEKGIQTLNTSLVQNFGIVIDRYVIIDIEGFREIVDTIGGVDIYVQEDMVYKDGYQNLDINLKKGMNHLDGKKAEQFVRFRKGYINQDLGRIDAQKIFMSAFLKKLFDSISISTAPELIGHFIKYVTTDVSLQEATYLGTKLLDMGMSNITMHTLQGTAGSNTYVNGTSYFSPYKNANIDLVNKYFNVFNKNLGPDNVSPKMLVAEPGNGKYNGGKTAEEIEKDNPDLKFSH